MQHQVEISINREKPKPVFVKKQLVAVFNPCKLGLVMHAVLMCSRSRYQNKNEIQYVTVFNTHEG